MSHFRVGSFVRHRNLPELGLGKVFCVSDRYVCVGFIDDAGRKQVKRLVTTVLDPLAPEDAAPQFQDWTVATTSDCREVLFTALAGKTSKGKKGHPSTASATLSLEQAVERFLTKYPGGMAATQYQRAERSWKASQNAIWREMFPAGRLRELTLADPIAAGGLVMKVVQTKDVALLSRQAELPRLNWALRKGAPAPFLLALADLLEATAPSAVTFERLIDTLESIPTREAGTRLLSWPTVSVLPFLASPEHHMFLKPKPTKAAAQLLGVDLFYNPRPSWDTYRRLLDWSQELLVALTACGESGV